MAPLSRRPSRIKTGGSDPTTRPSTDDPVDWKLQLRMSAVAMMCNPNWSACST